MNVFNGAAGRLLCPNLFRLQPCSYLVLQSRVWYATYRQRPVTGGFLLRRSSRDCTSILSKRLIRRSAPFDCRPYCNSQKSLKRTKEGEVRNYVSTVIDAEPIAQGGVRLEEEEEEEEKEAVACPKTREDSDWKEIRPNHGIGPYLSLAKSKLTCFVAMSAMAGYATAPGPFSLAALASCTVGVLLTSSAANAINQFFEVPYDSQMTRTMNRPLVRGLATPQQAAVFTAITGSLGIATLYWGTNPLTAALGLLNILIYTTIYTPMKRTSIANTWVGSVVGAIPPMMGWAAATGHLEVGAWLMGGVLFAWQFPHFCALSWNLRPDYSRAGYRMMSVVDPELCKRVSLRYSLALAGLSIAFPLCGVTSWVMTAAAAPANGYLAYLAWRFYDRGDSSSSRKLFKFSLVYLPVVLGFIIAGKSRDEVDGRSRGSEELNSPLLPSPPPLLPSHRGD